MNELEITLKGKLALEYFAQVEVVKALKEQVKVAADYITSLETQLGVNVSPRVEKDTELAKDLELTSNKKPSFAKPVMVTPIKVDPTKILVTGAWSPNEIALIQSAMESSSFNRRVDRIAAKLNRSESSLRPKMVSMGIQTKNGICSYKDN